jgi:hypothetical protein
MPDAAHAAAYAVGRHYPREGNVAEGLDATLINQEMRCIAVYFFGRSTRSRPDGRLATELFLLRFKPAEGNGWGMGSVRADRCRSRGGYPRAVPPDGTLARA